MTSARFCEETIEIRFSAPRELEAKLNQLKGLLAHKHPRLTLAKLVGKLAELGLAEWNPANSGRATMTKKTRAPLSQSNAANLAEKDAAKAISTAARREVWRRDQGKCINCGSRHAVEVDHRLPRSCGGLGAFESLRLLCRKCNQRAAIKVLGLKKMARYLESACPG